MIKDMKIMITLSVIVLTGIFCIGVAAAGQMLVAGLSLCVLAVLMFSVLYVSIQKRFNLISYCKQRLTEAKREAFFGNWERAFAKMRIVARDCPVSLDQLDLDESLARWCRIAGQKHLRSYDGRAFYE